MICSRVTNLVELRCTPLGLDWFVSNGHSTEVQECAKKGEVSWSKDSERMARITADSVEELLNTCIKVHKKDVHLEGSKRQIQDEDKRLYRTGKRREDFDIDMSYFWPSNFDFARQKYSLECNFSQFGSCL